MKPNVGTIDRIIRLIAGLAIGALGIYYNSWWGLLAILPLFTATIRWCPAYLPFGISTKCHGEGCKCNEDKKEDTEVKA